MPDIMNPHAGYQINPMRVTPYNMPNGKPLNVPGVQTLGNAGGNQFMGAGSIKDGSGRVKFWDGTQPSNVLPGMNPRAGYTDMAGWQASETSRRQNARAQAFGGGQPQFVGTGVPPVPGVVPGMAPPAIPPDASRNMGFNPMLAATGMQMGGNVGRIPAPEYNRRLDAMEAKKMRTWGGPGNFLEAMKVGGGMAMQNANLGAAMQKAGQEREHAMGMQNALFANNKDLAGINNQHAMGMQKGLLKANVNLAGMNNQHAMGLAGMNNQHAMGLAGINNQHAMGLERERQKMLLNPQQQIQKDILAGAAQQPGTNLGDLAAGAAAMFNQGGNAPGQDMGKVMAEIDAKSQKRQQGIVGGAQVSPEVPGNPSFTASDIAALQRQFAPEGKARPQAEIIHHGKSQGWSNERINKAILAVHGNPWFGNQATAEAPFPSLFSKIDPQTGKGSRSALGSLYDILTGRQNQ